MRIWNWRISEIHTELHAGSQRPLLNNSREYRHIMRLRLAVQNHISTSLTVSLEMNMFAVIQYPLVWCEDDCRNLHYQHRDHYCGFSWLCSKERDCVSSSPNNKAGYESGIQEWPYTCLEAPRRALVNLHAFDIDITWFNKDCLICQLGQMFLVISLLCK